MRLRVYAYAAGDYRVGYEPDAPAYRTSEDGTAVAVSVGADEVCLLASYTEEGALSRLRQVSGEGMHVVPLAEERGARLRAFWVERESFVPRREGFSFLPFPRLGSPERGAGTAKP